MIREPIKTELQIRRYRAGFTQLEIAKLLNVSRQTVTALESGATKMSMRYAVKLARFYDCEVANIFTDGV